jgi:hypothetical protein
MRSNIRKNVAPGSTLHTDEHKFYNVLNSEHNRNNTTNNIATAGNNNCFVRMIFGLINELNILGTFSTLHECCGYDLL